MRYSEHGILSQQLYEGSKRCDKDMKPADFSQRFCLSAALGVLGETIFLKYSPIEPTSVPFLRIEELRAGSDEKTQHSPAGIQTRVFRLPIGRSNHWATKPWQELRANSRLSLSCWFFFHYEVTLCLFLPDPAVSSSIFVGIKGENLIKNDPDKSELSTLQYVQSFWVFLYLSPSVYSLFDLRSETWSVDPWTPKLRREWQGWWQQTAAMLQSCQGRGWWTNHGLPASAWNFRGTSSLGVSTSYLTLKTMSMITTTRIEMMTAKSAIVARTLGKRERKGNYVRHVQNGADERNIAGLKKRETGRCMCVCVCERERERGGGGGGGVEWKTTNSIRLSFSPRWESMATCETLSGETPKSKSWRTRWWTERRHRHGYQAVGQPWPTGMPGCPVMLRPVAFPLRHSVNVNWLGMRPSDVPLW